MLCTIPYTPIVCDCMSRHHWPSRRCASSCTSGRLLLQPLVLVLLVRMRNGGPTQAVSSRRPGCARNLHHRMSPHELFFFPLSGLFPPLFRPVSFGLAAWRPSLPVPPPQTRLRRVLHCLAAF